MDNTIAMPQIAEFDLKVIGTSPLIVHAWSEKAKKEMLDKQMKHPNAGKQPKNPVRDYLDSMYWLTEVNGEYRQTLSPQINTVDMMEPNKKVKDLVAKGTFGFPAIGFKAAAITAVTTVDGMTKVAARQAFHINAEFIKIESEKPPEMREDMVRVGMGTSDLRYRGEFRHWTATLKIRHNQDALSVNQIVNLFTLAGFGVGVGEWRPEKDGQNGTFSVESL